MNFHISSACLGRSEVAKCVFGPEHALVTARVWAGPGYKVCGRARARARNSACLDQLGADLGQLQPNFGPTCSNFGQLGCNFRQLGCKIDKLGTNMALNCTILDQNGPLDGIKADIPKTYKF